MHYFTSFSKGVLTVILPGWIHYTKADTRVLLIWDFSRNFVSMHRPG